MPVRQMLWAPLGGSSVCQEFGEDSDERQPARGDQWFRARRCSYAGHKGRAKPLRNSVAREFAVPQDGLEGAAARSGRAARLDCA